MKVIIAGSRTIHSAPIDEIIKASGFEITEVVSGHHWEGVDVLGEQWARLHGLQPKTFPADWKRFGKSAGPRRNRQMAEYADALILIWNGITSGSANMLQEAEKRGLLIYQHKDVLD